MIANPQQSAVPLPVRSLADASLEWLGRVPFDRALQANAVAAAEVLAGGPGVLLAFEPDAPVFTLGRRARTPAGRAILASTLHRCAAQGIAVREVDRGGLGTLHLPGQLVVFVAIPCHRAGLRQLVADLLQAAAQVCAGLGVPAEVDLGERVGLWSPAGKIASIGLYEAHGVVRHGLALNVAIDADLGRGLALCGSAATTFTSLARLVPERPPPPLADVARQFARACRHGAAGWGAAVHAATSP